MVWQNTRSLKDLSWNTPIVYGWFRGDVCLYVGMSKHGLVRPMHSGHHIIGRIIKLRKTDKLCWSEYESLEHARVMEKFLIRNLEPKFNNGHGAEFKSKLAIYKLELAAL